MQISEKTLGILKNFSTINKGLVVKAGNSIRTKPDNQGQSSLIAKAIVEEDFPQDFALFNLNKFLSIVDLLGESPDFDFQEKFVTVRSGKQKMKYGYTSPLSISHPSYDKEINLPNVDAQFEITDINLKHLQRGVSFLGQGQVAFECKDGTIMARTFDEKNANADSFSIEIGECDKDFTMIFKAESLKFISQSYRIKLSFKGLAQWESEDVTYWTAASMKSTY